MVVVETDQAAWRKDGPHRTAVGYAIKYTYSIAS